MSATTFRNLIHRREHKERSQPAAREKYGLLEKHKDYVVRAKNFHDKEKRILALRRRAAGRNEEEYDHKMNNLKTKGGIHVKEAVGPKFSADELKLLKTQDRTYIQTLKNTEEKKIERLRGSLHGITELETKAVPGRSHMVFMDTLGEIAAKAEEEPKKDVVVDVAPPSKASAKATAEAAKVLKRSRKEMSNSYAELEERQERAGKMARLLTQMDSERELLKKGRRVKVADATESSGAIFRWKAERKK